MILFTLFSLISCFTVERDARHRAADGSTVVQRYKVELHGDVVSVDAFDAHAHDAHRHDNPVTQRHHTAHHTRSRIVASSGCTGTEMGDVSSARVALQVDLPTHVGLVMPGASIALRPGSALALFSPHESYHHRQHLVHDHVAHSFLMGHNCSWSPSHEEAQDHQVAMRVSTMRVVAGGHEGSDTVCGVGTCLVELTGTRTDGMHAFRRASIEYELIPPSDQTVDERMSSAGIIRRQQKRNDNNETEWDNEFESTLVNFNYDEEKEGATQSLRFARLGLKSPLSLASLSAECVDCYYYATRGTKLRLDVGWTASDGTIIELFKVHNYGESRLHVQLALRLWLGLQPFRYWGNLMPDIVIPKLPRGVPQIPFLIIGPVRFFGLFVFGLNLQTAIEFSGMVTGSFGFEKRSSWSETMTYRSGMVQPMVTRTEDDTGLQWLPFDLSASAERFVSGTRSNSHMPLILKVFARLVVFSSFKLGIVVPYYGLIPYVMIGPEVGISIDATDQCDLQFDLYKRYAVIVGVTVGKELYLWDRKDANGELIRGQKAGGLGLRFGFETFLDIFDDYAPFAIHRVDCPFCSSCLTVDPTGDIHVEFGSWMDFAEEGQRAAWDALSQAEKDRATALFAMSPVSAAAGGDLSFADSIGSTTCRSADTDSCVECGALAGNGCVWCLPSEGALEEEGACVESSRCNFVPLNAQCEIPSSVPQARVGGTTVEVTNARIVVTLPEQPVELDGSTIGEIYLRPEQTEERVAAFRAREVAIDVSLVPEVMRLGLDDVLSGAQRYYRLPWEDVEPFLASAFFEFAPLTGRQPTISQPLYRSITPGRYEVLMVLRDADDSIGSSAREFQLDQLVDITAEDLSHDFLGDAFSDVLYSPMSHCSQYCGFGKRTRRMMCVEEGGVEVPYGSDINSYDAYATCVDVKSRQALMATMSCSTGLACPEHDLLVEDPSASSSTLVLPGVPIPFANPLAEDYAAIGLVQHTQIGVSRAARFNAAVNAAHAAGEMYELGVFRASVSKAAPFKQVNMYLVDCQGRVAFLDSFSAGRSSDLFALHSTFFGDTDTAPGRYVVLASGADINGKDESLRLSASVKSSSPTSSTLVTPAHLLASLTEQGSISVSEPMYISNRVLTTVTGVLRPESPVLEDNTLIGYLMVEGSAGHASIDLVVSRDADQPQAATVDFRLEDEAIMLTDVGEYRRVFVRLLPEFGFVATHSSSLVHDTETSTPVLESLTFTQRRLGDRGTAEVSVTFQPSYDRTFTLFGGEKDGSSTAPLSFEFDLLDRSLWKEWFGPDSLDEECVWADALLNARRRKLKAGYTVTSSFRAAVDDDEAGLSTVALAAIVAGACLCLALVGTACAALFCIARRKTSSTAQKTAYALATTGYHGRPTGTRSRSASNRSVNRRSGSFRQAPRMSPTFA